MKNWTALAFCMLIYLFSGTASTLMSVYLPVAVPEILNQGPLSDARLGEVGAYINAVFLYGWMLGGILFGIISDRIGRKKSLVMVAALYGIATVSVVFVPNWYWLLGCRFVTGMGIGGVLVLTTVYISEIWEAKTRPIILGILAVSFPVGIVATGGLNLLFTNWRQAFWLGLIPVFVAVLIHFFLPESAAWQNGATATKKHQPRIFDLDNRRNLIVGSVIFGSVLIGLWGIFSWLPTWVQSLLPAGQDGQQERGFTMMLLGVGGVVGGVISGFLIKAIGNRKTLIITFLGCTIASCLLFTTNHTFSQKIYLELAFLSLFFGISQGTLSSYIPALFPASIRATAAGFCFNVGRFFTATAVFFVGTMVALLGGFGRALLVFSVLFLVAFITTYLNKELTIKQPLSPKT